MWIQITETAVRLVDCATMKLITQWTPTDGRINIATANDSQVLVALGGGSVYYIEITGKQLREVSRTTMSHEVFNYYICCGHLSH